MECFPPLTTSDLQVVSKLSVIDTDYRSFGGACLYLFTLTIIRFYVKNLYYAKNVKVNSSYITKRNY